VVYFKVVIGELHCNWPWPEKGSYGWNCNSKRQWNEWGFNAHTNYLNFHQSGIDNHYKVWHSHSQRSST